MTFDLNALMADAIGDVLAYGDRSPLGIISWRTAPERVQVLLDARDWPDYAQRIYDTLRDEGEPQLLEGMWEVVLHDGQMISAMLRIVVGADVIPVYMTRATHYALFGDICTRDVVDFSLYVSPLDESCPTVRTTGLGAKLRSLVGL